MLCVQLRKDNGSPENRLYLYKMPESGSRDDFREDEMLGWICIPTGSNTTYFNVVLHLSDDILVLRGQLRSKLLAERERRQQQASRNGE